MATVAGLVRPLDLSMKPTSATATTMTATIPMTLVRLEVSALPEGVVEALEDSEVDTTFVAV